MSHLIHPVAATVALGAAAVGLALAGAGPASAAPIGHPGPTVQVGPAGSSHLSPAVHVQAGGVVVATAGADGQVRLSVTDDRPLPNGDLRVVDRTSTDLSVAVAEHLTGVPVRITHHDTVVAGGSLTIAL